ncbi:MAG: ATP-NAD kinase family protein [Candidatus Bathyarchaeota archaeon]|nr:ATP-NAD kinase family protein [Candidatus Bathyarchaeota archaeon]MCX8177342.1 ATP-NAD kinase family protein [Candidatus Bathyarchaeota archaeon]MDW8193788.1 ATP-NAD kinase family protein [Nitrososphaerota archaeon]
MFESSSARKMGFIVNPIAGMGGAVGLKGTDGIEVLMKAIGMGAKPIAPLRAETFLSELMPYKDKIRLFVGAGAMGEDVAKNCNFPCVVIGERKELTSAEDTVHIAGEIKKMGADLLVFCGGDGTARDVLKAVNLSIPVLGVPTGVKMHSAVFGVTPAAAAKIAVRFLFEGLPLREAEVMDIDEEAFRSGWVSAELYGYMLVPYEPLLIQGVKIATPVAESELRNMAAIAIYMIENMEPDVVYIIGPGTTTRTIADLLDARKTLLGVDLFLNKKMIVKDANESQILETIRGKKAHIIVTPIGGQGFIFGRGNQQISPRVIRHVGLGNITVIATKSKIEKLRSLRVDTGDSNLDDEFRRRKIKVIVDYKMEQLMPVE